MEYGYHTIYPPICTIILIFILTTLITWAISHMISRTLIGNFIIGYNRKNIIYDT